MTTVRRLLCLAAFIVTALVVPVGVAAAAQQNPTTGQPGASSGVTCFSSPDTASAPGNAMAARGSVFNPNGVSGTVYAGNPGTASLAHANSTAAVSQYDIACLRVTQH